ncbi:hypothetical protein [Dulcicalothrix desertica]|uniref:hypothetical protein n=1 Tax=Dulcicalothrix desertica TaxID=32056 RepID=UPI000F8C7B49|nr:hypothetical protein [Dulcicalothrix desertica]
MSEIILFLECIAQRNFDELRNAARYFMTQHEPIELEEVFLTRIEPVLDKDSLQWLRTEKFTRLNLIMSKSCVVRN